MADDNVFVVIEYNWKRVGVYFLLEKKLRNGAGMLTKLEQI